MAIQRSVQQQNAVTKAEIERVAARGSSLAWLYAVLRSRELQPEAGLLVRLSEVPEQAGNVMSGVWLSQSLQFWEFEVMVSRASGELLSIDRFWDVTSSVPVAARGSGVGSSFGYLACQVLRETRGA